MRRRDFIKTTALSATAGMLLPSCVGKELSKTNTIGLQLYTLRDVFPQDMQGTLKRVAEIGYKELEAYGYSNGNMLTTPYAEVAKMVKDLGMRITSGHYFTGIQMPDMIGTLNNGWEKACEDAKAAGQEYMAIAFLLPNERGGLDEYKALCEKMNSAGEVCKQYGLKLAYHNHEFEFENFDGQIAYDLMLNELEPNLVTMEIDLYWVVRAGHDPIKYFEKYPGRFELWHVKDMDKDNPEQTAVAGEGSIDFEAIFREAELAGLKKFYVEQEHYKEDPLICVEKSFNYVKGIL
jgi:sugar phosphate isomerase/epimerase